MSWSRDIINISEYAGQKLGISRPREAATVTLGPPENEKR